MKGGETLPKDRREEDAGQEIKELVEGRLRKMRVK